MSVKQNHYNKRIKKGGHVVDFDKYKTDCKELNMKLDMYAADCNNGFDFYKESVLKKFIEGYKDIDDFAIQFLKLNEYNKTCKSPTGNTLEKAIILYGKNKGTEHYNNKPRFKKGKENPAYQHGGRLSPWSDKSEVHSEEVRRAAKAKIIETKKDPVKRGSNTKEYWMNKGFSGEEAIIKVKERQSTFSLEKCILKYGEEEGTKVFQKRQDKWQNTLKSKPQKEIDRINKLKANSSGFVQQKIKHLEGFANRNCTLYYIKINDTCYKIGVTSQTLNQRFGRRTKYEIIHLREGRYEDMFNEEQRILKKFKKYRIKYKTDTFSTTEAFNTNILLKQ